MKYRPHPFSLSHKRGVALVLVLIFVVLVTVVVVAYFSRATLERQVSNGSAAVARADLLANSASEVITADLIQEIVSGSAAPAPAFANGTNLYTPVTTGPTAGATMVPLISGAPPVSSTGVLPIPNLVRRSVRTSDSTYVPPPSYYTNFPPNRASAVNSEKDASLNGRSVDRSRWNTHYLIPRDPNNYDGRGATTATTIGTNPIPEFTAPDWVIMTRGNQPGLNSSGAVITATDLITLRDPSNDNFAVGRYAYTIFNEGGLLDMNVAGYPSKPGILTTAQWASRVSNKASQVFADLTNVPTSGANNFLSTTAIDKIVSWRNFATLQQGTNYSGYIDYGFNAPSNFLSVNPIPFVSATGKTSTDQSFATRQRLTQYRRYNGMAQDSLQYMATFTRDLNQPSYSPDAGRPKIAAIGSGGNDMAGKDAGVSASNINPSFLLARVPGTPMMIRNDGTNATEGDPLVKKRFALSRLAWLTYQGVSANRNISSPSSSAISPDYDIYLLETSYSVTQSFLQQGNAANVYKYFGLSWVSDSRPSGSNGPGDNQMKWVYNHGKPNPPAGITTTPITSLSAIVAGPIMSLSQVALAGREPDFVELLKASVTAGSLGKSGTTGVGGTPGGYENQKDTSVDAHIIQIAANIMDQADTDGVSTRILFDDATWSTAQEYRGVEDLPYFYRLRGGYFPVKDCIPAVYNEPLQPAGLTPAGVNQLGYVHPYNAATFTNPGLAVAFQEPEIWNPHSWNSSAAIGPRPTQFRVVAIDAPPSLSTPLASDPNQLTTQASVRYVSNPGTDSNPPYNYCPVSVAPQHAISLTPDSTALTFTIASNRLDLFREPTLLIKPGVPSGSQLQFGANNQVYSNVETAIAGYLLPDPVTGIKGMKSTISGPVTGTGATDNNLYLGIYLGCFPLYWHDSNYVYTTNFVTVSGAGASTITYRMQYQDPLNAGNWITYDEKYTGIVYDGGRNSNTVKGVGNAMAGDDGVVSTCLDPRSPRFGMIRNLSNYASNAGTLWPVISRNLANGYNVNQAGWAGSPTGGYNGTYQQAAVQNALWTARPDENSGFTANKPSVPGWYVGSLDFRPGMLSQNNPAAYQSDARFAPGNGNGGEGGLGGPVYYTDADGVVRRGMAAYVPPIGAAAATIPVSPVGAASGDPQKVANTFVTTGAGAGGGNSNPIAAEAPSRPIILNRPFRTVAELGYVYSGTPWRNLDFSTPESGSTALLDVFTTNDTDNADGLIAGRINLNTRQAPVLRTVLAGAAKDEFTPSTALAATGTGSAQAIAQALVARTISTSAGLGPLTNISELVGKWGGTTINASPGGVDGGQSYLGFSGVAATASYAPPSPAVDLSAVLAADSTPAGYTTAKVLRYREAAMRALSNNGTTRVWNLMIDVIAQTGRYPVTASDLSKFVVEGEQRYWVHLAIDRLTGQIIDKQIEVVKE